MLNGYTWFATVCQYINLHNWAKWRTDKQLAETLNCV
jgi:hypothetical protein